MKSLETDVKINLETAFFFSFPRLWKRATLCNSPGSRRFFFFSKWCYFSITKAYILYCSRSKIPQPLATPSASCVWGLPFESKLFVRRHYLSRNSSVQTWLGHHYSGDSLSPSECKICQCSPPATFYWKIVDFWPDKQFSFEWGLAVRMGIILTCLSSKNVLSCFRSYCLFSNTWRWILKKRRHAKMSMCSSVSMLNVRIDLKVFWNESVLKNNNNTQRMLITHLHCWMTFPFSK